MRNAFKIAALTLVATVTSALAESLPSAPTVPAAPVPPTIATSDTTFYAGIYAGSLAKKPDVWYNNLYLGANAGYQFNSFVRAEATYDYNRGYRFTEGSNALMGNLILQYDVSWLPVTPYVLAGAGYRWAPIKNEYIWNVGAGLRYPINDSFDIDARYRYISDFDRYSPANVITLGVNYKF